MSDSLRRWLFWLAVIFLFAAALYVFRHILLPFVLGMAIAYALDPAADRMVSWGVPRSIASGLILFAFFALFALVIVLLFPLLEEQTIRLAKQIPDAIAWSREHLTMFVERLRGQIRPEDVEKLQEATTSYVAGIFEWFTKAASSLWSGGLALIDVLALLLVTPIVAYYLLKDWDDLVARIDSWLPRQQIEMIRAQCREIDRLISEYVRGVILVCLIQAAYYGIALTLAGLDYGAIIGIIAGVLSFVPFVGAIVGFTAAVGVAIFQFQTVVPVAIVAAIIVVGHLLESNLVTPRLVGERVGLHPVWAMFALFAGGVVFGFVGVLLAVPLAAVIGVLTRFALGQYLRCPLYLGSGPGPGKDTGSPNHPHP
ncbi:MAG: AI-2E family transporter [Alphaproteobacteria bacterium]